MSYLLVYPALVSNHASRKNLCNSTHTLFLLCSYGMNYLIQQMQSSLQRMVRPPTSVLSLYSPFATNELKRISSEFYGYNMLYEL